MAYVYRYLTIFLLSMSLCVIFQHGTLSMAQESETEDPVDETNKPDYNNDDEGEDTTPPDAVPNTSTQVPGTQAPGTQAPGTQDPGTQDPTTVDTTNNMEVTTDNMEVTTNNMVVTTNNMVVNNTKTTLAKNTQYITYQSTTKTTVKSVVSTTPSETNGITVTDFDAKNEFLDNKTLPNGGSSASTAATEVIGNTTGSISPDSTTIPAIQNGTMLIRSSGVGEIAPSKVVISALSSLLLVLFALIM